MGRFVPVRRVFIDTALGLDALGANTTGTSNTVLGFEVALTTLDGGSNNILIGTSSAVDTPAAGTNNFLNIGNVIFATGMTGTLSSPAGNVGIGTTNPQAALSFGTLSNSPGIYLYDGGSGARYGFGIRASELQLHVPNSGHISFNKGGDLQTSGSNELMRIDGGGNVGIGTTSPTLGLSIAGNGTGASSAAIDIMNTGSGGKDWQIYSTDGVFSQGSGKLLFYRNWSGGDGSSSTLTLDPSGNVGIGTTSPAQALEVNGEIQVDTLASASGTNLCINGSVISSCSSSIRYKENVKDLDIGLNEILRMRPVSFKWKGRDENDLGLIAEEVHDVSPLLNTYTKDGKVEGVKYSQLTAVLVNAVKEQQKEIKAMQDKAGGKDASQMLNANGYAHLALSSKEPIKCSDSNQGTIALTHLARICACNGKSWIFADSTAAACSW